MKNRKQNNEPLKVVYFGQKNTLSREGGVEIVVKELATRMVQKGCQVTCLDRGGHHVSGEEFDTTKLKNYKGVEIRHVPTIQSRGLAALSSSFFAAIVSAFGKYDVVHIHAEGPAFMCWLPKLFGKKVIVTIHGLDWARAKWGKFASWYIRTGEKMAVKHADEIIVLSQGVRDYFLEKHGRETQFIPNGVNKATAVEVDEIKKIWGLEKDEYVLYLGRIVPEKGEKYLIEAFKNITTDKKLVIAGGSSDTDGFMQELKKIAESDERIIFTGFVQGRKLEELYSNSYIYCLPSDLEGMPLSLLEGMSYGNCCLTSDIPECAEVVENKAVVFHKSDVEDLRVKLQALIDKPEMVNEYKKMAANFICDKYNWNDVSENTWRLYR